VATNSSMTNLLLSRKSQNYLNNDEHTLILVTTKMIYSAVYKCKRFVLKHGHPHHMVKFVGAVRNYSENIRNVIKNVEDGMGLVWVILWQKQNECMEAQRLIHECNGKC
jgi:hypothetical protein